MRKAHVLLALLCLASTLSSAQNPQPELLCEVHINKVKPGMNAQYEQARAKHMAWHKSQNDTWSWVTWEIVTGPNTGSYAITSCGHTWKDFDTREKFNAADAQNANATMGNTLESETVFYEVLRPELSASVTAGPPPAYLTVLNFYLKPESALEFRTAVGQVNQAFSKTNTPRANGYWYVLASGGEGPQMTLVQERKSMADMAPASPKTLDEMMKEAYGDQGTQTMMTLRKAYYRTQSQLLHYRPDLSYTVQSAK